MGVIRNFLKRPKGLAKASCLLALLIAVIGLAAMWISVGLAEETITGTLTLSSCPDLTISTSIVPDHGSWSAGSDGKSISGTATSTAESGCWSTTYTPNASSLTFKNDTSDRYVLSYYVTFSNGTLDNDHEANVQTTRPLLPSESDTLSITSLESDDTATISITNISFEKVVDVSVTFSPTTNGTFTVDETEITEDTVINKTSMDAFVVSATPASTSYKFMEWRDLTNGKTISTDASTSLYVQSSCQISPVFVKTSVPVFLCGTQAFSNLKTANTYCTKNGVKQITLISNGTVAKGSYTISSGITLLIPFDASYTCFREQPEILYNSWVAPTAYRIMTMANGAKITVSSGASICCSGKLSSKGQLGGHNGTPTGPGGRICMNSTSSIVLENGANLYVWGHIYENKKSRGGTIIAKSGSTVYEAFQIKDWRGGTATSNCYDYVFPMSQYYIQNIECKIEFQAGSIEKLASAVNALSAAYPVGATFIGGASSGALFILKSGVLTKDYIEEEDRLKVAFQGEGTLGSLTLTGIPMVGSVSTDTYDLPINSNISINIESGHVGLSQDVKMLPGATITIAEGASFSVSAGKNILLYDSDDWLNLPDNGGSAHYTGKAVLYVIGYSAFNGKTAKRTAANLVDAKIDVNGDMVIEGSIYTSKGGASIITSERTGKITIASKPASTAVTVYEMHDNSTKKEVSFDPARFHNLNVETGAVGTPEYTASADDDKGAEYVFFGSQVGGDDKWHYYCTVSFSAGSESGVTFVDDTDSGISEPPSYKITRSASWSFAFKSANVTWHYEREGYRQIGWYDDRDNAYSMSFSLKDMVKDYVFRPRWIKTDSYYVAYVDDIDGRRVENTYRKIDSPVITTPTSEQATSADNIYRFNSAYTIKGWTTSDGLYMATSVSIALQRDYDFLAFRGGWLTRDGNTYYIERNAYDYEDGLCKGVVRCEDPDDSTKTHVYKFNETTGAFDATFCGSYSGYCFVNGVTLESEGLYRLSNGTTCDYYFILPNLTVLRGVDNYFIDGVLLNGYLASGYYSFDSTGKLIETATSKDYTGETYLETEEGTEYLCIDGIRVGYGLFQQNGHYRYAKQDGSLAKGETVYVTKTNGLLAAGLYYFDAEGYLWDFELGDRK